MDRVHHNHCDPLCSSKHKSSDEVLLLEREAHEITPGHPEYEPHSSSERHMVGEAKKARLV